MEERRIGVLAWRVGAYDKTDTTKKPLQNEKGTKAFVRKASIMAPLKETRQRGTYNHQKIRERS